MGLDLKRVSAIAKAMFDTCAPLRGQISAVEAANDALTDARESANGTRGAILTKVAALSASDRWTKDEIKAATKAAIELINDKSERTLATFLGELRRAADPATRDIFPALVDVCHRAWNAEVDQHKMDNDLPMPIRKAFGRICEASKTLCNQAAETGCDLGFGTQPALSSRRH